MNIFISDPCPKKCAEYLDDKRAVKMVVETAQILSTVIHGQDLEFHSNYSLYKPTHINHPCVKWAADDINNFKWLIRHFQALLDEYTARYNKVHSCQRFLKVFYLYSIKSLQEYIAPIKFVNCTRNKEHGIDYTSVQNTFFAYQLYLNDRWENDKRAPRWHGEE